MHFTGLICYLYNTLARLLLLMLISVRSEVLSMNEDLLKTIQDYQAQHPEIVEIMKLFQISQDTYERALKAMLLPVQSYHPTVYRSDEGPYNVHVSMAN